MQCGSASVAPSVDNPSNPVSLVTGGLLVDNLRVLENDTCVGDGNEVTYPRLSLRGLH